MECLIFLHYPDLGSYPCPGLHYKIKPPDGSGGGPGPKADDWTLGTFRFPTGTPGKWHHTIWLNPERNTGVRRTELVARWYLDKSCLTMIRFGSNTFDFGTVYMDKGGIKHGRQVKCVCLRKVGLRGIYVGDSFHHLVTCAHPKADACRPLAVGCKLNRCGRWPPPLKIDR